MLIESDDIVNNRIKLIIQGWNFFSDLEVLAFVLNPLRKAILLLEAHMIILADCYFYLAQLGLVLKNLPQSFNSEFHNYCHTVMNKWFIEFEDNKYLLCFFYIHNIEVFNI